MKHNPKHNKKQAYLNCLRMTGLMVGIICANFLICYICGVFPASNTPKSNTIQKIQQIAQQLKT